MECPIPMRHGKMALTQIDSKTSKLSDKGDSSILSEILQNKAAMPISLSNSATSARETNDFRSMRVFDDKLVLI